MKEYNETLSSMINSAIEDLHKESQWENNNQDFFVHLEKEYLKFRQEQGCSTRKLLKKNGRRN